MYKHAPKRIVLWPMDMPQRDADGGEAPDQRMLIRFKLLTRIEIQDRRHDNIRTTSDTILPKGEKEGVEQIIERIEERNKRDEALLRERLIGWRDPATGESADFSDEEKSELLADMPSFFALRDGLLEASEHAKAKNLLPGPASPAAAVQTNASAGGEAE